MTPKDVESEHSTAMMETGMQYLSVWEEDTSDETISPLMEQSASSLNSQVYFPANRALSPVSSPSRRSKKQRSSANDYELKNARDALVGSTMAVINFLRSSGVPKPSCDQLDKNLELGRYFAVLKRVQDYIHCIPSASEDETLAKIHLAVSAWEALCRLKSIEYKRAYKQCFSLRYELKGTSQEIKKAIAFQVKVAEQCTACQKKLYLVQKWQRSILHRMKRSTTIQPEGYQPIRCL